MNHMMDHLRENDFLKFQGQTNQSPYLIDIDRAEGIYIWDKTGKRFADMIAGVAVTNIGHRHPQVIEAIQSQLEKHLHVMVYGEYIQDSQLALAKNIASLLPDSLSCTYVVNSGTEANEAALKLAKRCTGRHELIAFKGSYHGNTHGSMSVSWNETKKAKFRPLLPGVKFIELNNFDDLQEITHQTAGVILETIQADAGVRKPTQEYLNALRKRCTEAGAFLILDEVQVGMGRTGTFFAFEQYNIVPDVLTVGKSLGGGMPIGAFISSHQNMQMLTQDPILGHITTFGGHPVICAAANACVDVLKTETWIHDTEMKGALLESILAQHDEVIEIRRAGLLFAIEMKSPERVQRVVEKCLEKGIITFWFLSNPDSFRLSPPLCITVQEIEIIGNQILDAIRETE